MKQELEIEYKNLLNPDEYHKILNGEFPNKSTNHKIVQTNHYFDTQDKLLKKNQAAVRIRRLATENELTFKVPAQGFLMESNLILTDEQADFILDTKQFSLAEITSKEIDLNIPTLTNQSTFEHFNQFTTIRFEKQVDQHLIVLDQTTFQNGVIDFELEVETNDPTQGKVFFNTLLEKYGIPSRSTLPKIARAEKNR